MAKLKKYMNEGLDPLVSAFREVTDDMGSKFDSIVKQVRVYDPKLAKKMDKYFNDYFKKMGDLQLDAEWARKKVVNP